MPTSQSGVERNDDYGNNRDKSPVSLPRALCHRDGAAWRGDSFVVLIIVFFCVFWRTPFVQVT